jgi:predicted dehydrogenase
MESKREEFMAKKKDIARVGLSGLGSFSAAIGTAVKRSQRLELVTCFDPLPERRAVAVEQYGCAQEKSFADMVNRDDLDGILLVTPNALHCEQTEMAVKCGKHVYVEKPIANTIADGKRMIEACEKARVTLMVGHMMRRYAGNRKVKELIDGGAIGKPVLVEANLSSGQGWELTPDQFRWRGDDSGCYLGCSFASPRTNWMYVYGTEANLLRTVGRPDRPFKEYLTRGPSADHFTRVELFEKGKDAPRQIPLVPGDPIQEEIDEFADCILTGKKPETDGLAGLRALALIRASIESARTGKPVDLEI